MTSQELQVRFAFTNINDIEIWEVSEGNCALYLGPERLARLALDLIKAERAAKNDTGTAKGQESKDQGRMG